jgi:16S rRNA (cytidine1402-2'-O)-methyltransferase
MLYVISTPIGNLSDITLRAIDILKDVDYILCEDTRHSSKLLNHYEIKKPLKSYHKFSEAKMEEPIIDDLKSGKKIALISDAGTPGIADPGARLIKACIENEIEVVPIPGACALIHALVGSGLDTDRFQFVGFLAKKQGELRTILHELLGYPGTSICYESPNRIVDVLKMLSEMSPNREVVIARELTKTFEEFIRGTALDLYNRLIEKEIKGEVVLLIAKGVEEIDWSKISPAEHVEKVMKEYGVTKQEAIKLVAKERGAKKRDIYKVMTE